MNNSLQKHYYNFQHFINGMSRSEIAIYLFALTSLGNLFLVLAITWFTDPMTGTTEYKEIATNVANGNGFVFTEGQEKILWRPPLYIYILSAFYYVFERPYPFIIAFQIVLNGLTGIMVFIIGDKIFNRSIGFFAALLLLIYPLFTYNCIRLMPEAVYSFFLSIIVYLSIDFFNKPSRKLSLIHGLFLGLATLLKAAIQFLPIFYFIAAILFVKNREKRRAILINTGLVFVLMLCVIAPWTVRNYTVSNEFILLDTSGGYTFWVGNRIESNGYDDDPLSKEEFLKIEKEIARILGIDHTPSFDVSKTAWVSGANSSKLYKEGIKNIIADPIGIMRLAFKKFYRLWFWYVGERPNIQFAVFILQTLLLIPACLGLYFAVKDGKAIFPIVLIIVYYSMLHMAATANVRYSVPLVPYVSLLAIYGISQIKRYFRF